ncbi:MAG: LacI family DNA-binding transcriptional regulator [Bacilli bacterium]
MVKLKDIAEKSNTTPATVSKALHDSDELSSETIARIKKIANEMGYVPNAYAQALKNKKSFSIGVIYFDATCGGLKHEYFSTILNAIKVEAESQGYNITFISKTNKPKMSYLQMARYRNMDGVIIVTENFSNPDIAELANSSIPVVTIDYIFNSCSSVLSDNEEGNRKLVEYIAGLGHRKIAYIYGDDTDVTKKRNVGFYVGMKEKGIPVNPNWVIHGQFHSPSVTGKIVKSLMSSYDKPTCIMTPDDISTLGALSALNDLGYRVPEDISVVGYDGIDLSRMFRPMFTTYVQNSEELGRQAARALIERIDNPTTFSPKSVCVSGYVQEGGTTRKIN